MQSSGTRVPCQREFPAINTGLLTDNEKIGAIGVEEIDSFLSTA